MEKTKNLLTFADGPKEVSKEKKKGGGGRVSHAHFTSIKNKKSTYFKMCKTLTLKKFENNGMFPEFNS